MQKLRNLGHEKKGVTPVIATILLIAGTIVLALVVGAYTFGLFGSNVKTIQLNSATLFGGPLPASASCSTTGAAYISLALNNPGAATNISSITLTGSSLPSAVVPVGANAIWTTRGGACLPIVAATQPGVSAGAVTTLNVFFQSGSATVGTLTTGQTFNYVISFVNGQSVSGSLLAQ
jgi:flagellin-like protein